MRRRPNSSRLPAAACSIVLALAASACGTPRSDLTAINTKDTGQYEVLAQSQK
jgi:hypothetical protein